MKTLIKNIDILTMDEKLGQIQGGCILIEDDEIAFAGSEADLGKADDYDIIEDGRGMLAIPGLANTHTHTAMSLFRGYANDLPLMKWLEELIWPAEDRLEEADAYWLSLLAIAEMIRGGVTAFADMYMFMEQTAQPYSIPGFEGFWPGAFRVRMGNPITDWKRTGYSGKTGMEKGTTESR